MTSDSGVEYPADSFTILKGIPDAHVTVKYQTPKSHVLWGRERDSESRRERERERASLGTIQTGGLGRRPCKNSASPRHCLLPNTHYFEGNSACPSGRRSSSLHVEDFLRTLIGVKTDTSMSWVTISSQPLLSQLLLIPTSSTASKTAPPNSTSNCARKCRLHMAN